MSEKEEQELQSNDMFGTSNGDDAGMVTGLFTLRDPVTIRSDLCPVGVDEKSIWAFGSLEEDLGGNIRKERDFGCRAAGRSRRGRDDACPHTAGVPDDAEEDMRVGVRG